MNKKYVISLEISKRMKDLGFKQESLWYWEESTHSIKNNDKTFTLALLKERRLKAIWIKYYSAYTVAELGTILPDWFFTMRLDGGRGWCCVDEDAPIDSYGVKIDKKGGYYPECLADTEANARGLMACYLKENKLLEVK